jgi:hypothetical protein
MQWHDNFFSDRASDREECFHPKQIDRRKKFAVVSGLSDLCRFVGCPQSFPKRSSIPIVTEHSVIDVRARKS